MEGPLRKLLQSGPAIDALVGQRVYVSAAPPRPVYPYLLITQTTSDEWETMAEAGGTRRVEFDIDAKARTAKQAAAVIKAVRRFLSNYTGPAAAETVQATEISGEASDHEPPTDGRDFGIFTKTLDVAITYAEVDE